MTLKDKILEIIETNRGKTPECILLGTQEWKIAASSVYYTPSQETYMGIKVCRVLNDSLLHIKFHDV